MKIYMPNMILSSLIVVMGLVFLIMMIWYILQAPLMSMILAMESSISAEGNRSVTLLKLAVDLWGVVAAVLLLVTYGIMQAQKKEWRGERV